MSPVRKPKFQRSPIKWAQPYDANVQSLLPQVLAVTPFASSMTPSPRRWKPWMDREGSRVHENPATGPEKPRINDQHQTDHQQPWHWSMPKKHSVFQVQRYQNMIWMPLLFLELPLLGLIQSKSWDLANWPWKKFFPLLLIWLRMGNNCYITL